MSNIDKRALREAAERAGQNDWEYVYTSDLSAPGRGYITVGGAEAIYCLNKAAGGVKQSENVLRYIAAASPETMLTLLNEIAEQHCLSEKKCTPKLWVGCWMSWMPKTGGLLSWRRATETFVRQWLAFTTQSLEVGLIRRWRPF